MEYITYADDAAAKECDADGAGPDSFDPKKACIVTRRPRLARCLRAIARPGMGLKQVASLPIPTRAPETACTTDDHSVGLSTEPAPMPTRPNDSILRPTSATPSGQPTTPPRRTGWLTNTRIRSRTRDRLGQQHAAGHPFAFYVLNDKFGSKGPTAARAS